MKRNELPVYLYSANIVGYFRLAFLFIGLFVVRAHPVIGASCFISNLILDAVDGHLARMLNQVSAFGAILDYTIDRISFASYAILLATVYPEYMFLLCVCLNLDLASHFFHLKSSHVLNKISHKDVAGEPLILRLYYKKVILGATCLTHDLFFILLYLYHFFPSLALEFCLSVTFVGVLFKVAVHLTQIVRASMNLLTIKKIV